MLITRVLPIAALALAIPFAAQAADDPVVGTWWNVKKNAHITIEPCGASMCGKISWMEEPNLANGNPKVDANNEDETLQTRPILGLQIIGGFEKDEVGKWEDGDIYNPNDGKTYSSNMQILENGHLEVEGCVFFICQEQIWEPVKQ